MIPAFIVIALLWMPIEPVTASEDWYAPVVIEYVDEEPSEADIGNEWTNEAPE